MIHTASHTDARRLSPEAQEALRRRAILALRSGKEVAEVAALFRVSPQAVRNWKRRCARGGLRALRSKPRGRPVGSGARLKPWQAAQVAKVVVHHLPDQLRLPFALWTREAVARYIRRRFKVSVSVVTVGRYLRRWGFTPQKPIRRAYERDPERIAAWLTTEYPKIKALAQRLHAAILWGDEMGCRSDHQAGRTYGRRGQTPIVPGTGKRFRCNVISAIGNRGELAFMVFRGSCNAQVFIAFLVRLLRYAGRRKVFLIVDSYSAHTAKVVERWVAARSDRLRLFFLPTYAPELNPDELLNQDVKTNAVGRKRAATLGELEGNVRGHLWSRQRQPHVVRRFFHEEHVRYAA